MKFCPREPHHPPPPHLLFVEPKVYDPWAPRQVQAAGQAIESKKEIFGKVMMKAKPEIFSKEYMKLVKAFPVAAKKMPAKKIVEGKFRRDHAMKAKPAKKIVKAFPVAARRLLKAIQRRRL